MNERLVCSGGLVLALFFAAGCRRTQMMSRPLLVHEMSWDEAIKRWYPRWQTPFFPPVRGAGGEQTTAESLDYLSTPDRTWAPTPQETGADQAVDERIELVPAVPQGGAP